MVIGDGVSAFSSVFAPATAPFPFNDSGLFFENQDGEDFKVRKPMKTKQRKTANWGGKRANAGRKPTPASQFDPDQLVIPAGLSAEEKKRFIEDKALEWLAQVASTSASDSARVAACKELLDRVCGKPAPAKPAEAEADAPDHWGSLLGSKPAAKATAN